VWLSTSGAVDVQGKNMGWNLPLPAHALFYDGFALFRLEVFGGTESRGVA